MPETPQQDTPKPNGFYKQPQDDLYVARIKLIAGHITSDQLRVLADAADQFGEGVVHLTTRQGVELHDIRDAETEGLADLLSTGGLACGGTGKRVRTIIACPGSRCKYGLIDSQAIAEVLNARLQDYEGLASKFKVAISGCPNGCTSPQATCIGIMGGRRKDDEGVAREAFVLYAGGKMGKRPMIGQRLPVKVSGLETLADVCATIVEWYRDQAEQRERLANTLKRLGMDALMNHLTATTDIGG